jgi:hypothetical protein
MRKSEQVPKLMGDGVVGRFGLTFEMPVEWPSVAHSPVRVITWYWY